MNRASPISDLEDMGLPLIIYYGKLWETEMKNVKSETDKANRRGK